MLDTEVIQQEDERLGSIQNRNEFGQFDWDI
jgi:hypothetical protein